VTAAGTAGVLCLSAVSGVVGTSAAGAATSGRTILAGSLVTAKAASTQRVPCPSLPG